MNIGKRQKTIFRYYCEEDDLGYKIASKNINDL